MQIQIAPQTLAAFQNKKILLTGASGYIATKLGQLLSSVDCEIIRLSRQSALPPLFGKAQVTNIVGELGNPEILEKCIPDVNYIFHLAAQTSIYKAAEKPEDDCRINVSPLLSLLEFCKAKNHHPVIVQAGTVTQVGLPQTLPVNESPADHPTTIYDLHKLFAEKYLELYSQLGIISGVTLRLANVYGPGPKSSVADRGILNMMVRRALAGEMLTVYGEGNYVRDYVYIDDVANAFLMAAAQISTTSGKHFVIGSSEPHTIKDAFQKVASQVEAKTGKKVKIAHVDAPAALPPIETRNFVADTASFRQASGWQALVSLNQGIDLTIEAFQ